MKKQVIFSGIQPSGDLHIGNYIGAIRQWVKLQNSTHEDVTNDMFFCIVDLHAVTVYQDPQKLREKIVEVAALYLACGIDPKKSHVFVQSENPDHTYAAWLTQCVSPYAWLTHMTQFKDKSTKQGEATSTGLFTYPTLMAMDILLYDTDLVPVGEDQTQHIELTCDVANRFNKMYREIFKLPRAMIDKSAARIMSLQSPQSKMSKSDKDPAGTINLLDDPDTVVKKVKRAVTDSEPAVKGERYIGKEYKTDGVSNLVTIYASCTGKTVEDSFKHFDGKGYGLFKGEVAEAVVEFLKPVQQRHSQLVSEKTELMKVLDEARDYARDISSKKLSDMKQIMGLGR